MECQPAGSQYFQFSSDLDVSYLDGGEETGAGECAGGASQLLGSVEESFILSLSDGSVVGENRAVVEALVNLG